MFLLLIEDNLDLTENLIEFFEARGHTVEPAYNGIAGLQLALKHDYDVIILDLMLPMLDGLQVCARLRQQGCATPILMLTARDTLLDKLQGFEQGADDYLIKPFALLELEARLTALGRRKQNAFLKQPLLVADLRLDPETLLVERQGRRITLAPIPLKILILLMRRSPTVVSREEIEREIWGDSTPDSDTLRAHMHALRSAIDRDCDTPLLHTQRGMGYQLASLHGG